MPRWIAVVLLAATTANAASPRPEAALFDRPAMIEERPAQAADGARCTSYADVSVLETGTGTPAPDAATLFTGGGCLADRKVATLADASRSFVGRKGAFLWFEATDPHGAVAFAVVDATSGRVVYGDSEHGDGLRSVVLEAGALHVRYVRAVNAPCSIPADPGGCWRTMVAGGLIPRELGAVPPPLAACAAAYRRGPVPPDDPSIVTYAVDMTIERSGATRVAARGMPGCEALP